jgi:hypothetical protein
MDPRNYPTVLIIKVKHHAQYSPEPELSNKSVVVHNEGFDQIRTSSHSIDYRILSMIMIL